MYSGRLLAFLISLAAVSTGRGILSPRNACSQTYSYAAGFATNGGMEEACNTDCTDGTCSDDTKNKEWVCNCPAPTAPAPAPAPAAATCIEGNIWAPLTMPPTTESNAQDLALCQAGCKGGTCIVPENTPDYWQCTGCPST